MNKKELWIVVAVTYKVSNYQSSEILKWFINKE